MRTAYILKDVGSDMSYGDECIRHYLPGVINNSKNDILNQFESHSLYGFAFYVNRIWLNEYETECVEHFFYVCNRRSEGCMYNNSKITILS